MSETSNIETGIGYTSNPNYAKYYKWFNENFKSNGFNECPPAEYVPLTTPWH